MRDFHDDLLEQHLDLGRFLGRVREVLGDGIHHLSDIPNLAREGLKLGLDLIRPRSGRREHAPDR